MLHAFIKPGPPTRFLKHFTRARTRLFHSLSCRGLTFRPFPFSRRGIIAKQMQLKSRPFNCLKAISRYKTWGTKFNNYRNEFSMSIARKKSKYCNQYLIIAIIKYKCVSFQTEICSSALTDVIHAVINGTDGCLFCFGHAGLGKLKVFQVM